MSNTLRLPVSSHWKFSSHKKRITSRELHNHHLFLSYLIWELFSSYEKGISSLVTLLVEQREQLRFVYSSSSSTSSTFRIRLSGLSPSELISIYGSYRQQDNLDGWSAGQKAATDRGQLKHRRNADTQPCLEWDSNPRFQCLSREELSCVRKHRHYDRRFANCNSKIGLLFTEVWECDFSPAYPHQLIVHLLARHIIEAGFFFPFHR
jgi:hypothetical protein